MTGTDFEQLLATLYLENAGDSTFVGTHPEKTPSRTFGGQLMAQAVVAAAHTVKHTLPSAMHMHFISGGGPVLSTHVLATLGIRNAFEIGDPSLGVATVITALPVLVPLVIFLMRMLRRKEAEA